MAEPKKSDQLLCPSYIAKPGAKLFGFAKDGKIQLLPQLITIDEEFIERASKHGPPEERFRFAGRCIEGSCGQWNHDKQHCGLAEKLKATDEQSADFDLQTCPIRDGCRWFKQNGKNACVNCSDVVRNIEMERLEKAS